MQMWRGLLVSYRYVLLNWQLMRNKKEANMPPGKII